MIATRYTRCAALAASIALGACTDRPALFDTEPGGATGRAPSVALAADLGDLYASDTVQVLARSAGDALRVQLLVLDSAGAVVWRSTAVTAVRDTARVPLADLPSGYALGAPLRLTAAASNSAGDRFYAADDSSAVARVAEAAIRSPRVFTGSRVRTAAGVSPDVTVAPELGRAYFALPAVGAIGVIDLAERRWIGNVSAGAGPERLAYRSGVLAVLGAGGGQLGFLRASAGGLELIGRGLLPPQELDLDTSYSAAVRPTARALTLGCALDGCEELSAFTTSGLEVLRGSLASGGGEPGVLRYAAVTAAGGGASRVVVPGHLAALIGDSATTASVYGVEMPGGARKLTQRRGDASRCLAAGLGGELLAATPDGAVFVGGAPRGLLCGSGTRLVRIDGAATDAPRVSEVALRAARGEERIGAARDIQVADDGSAVLLLTADGVVVVDPLLRVRGTLSVPGARAAAWLRGAPAARFAVADSTGVTLFDASSLAPMGRVPLGVTEGRIVYVRLPSGSEVLVATIRDGFVVAPTPNPSTHK